MRRPSGSGCGSGSRRRSGIIAGVSLISQRREAPCPPGKDFAPGNDDPTCYAYPRWELGVGILTLSIIAALVLVFASIAARAALRSLDPTKA